MKRDEVVNKLESIFKSFKTKPILFIGSGLSRRYIDSPSWKELLIHFSNLIRPDDPFSFNYYINEAKTRSELSNAAEIELYPMVAQIIELDYNSRFFRENDFQIEIKAIHSDEIIRGLSPFRIAVSNYLSSFKYKNMTYFNEEKNLLFIKDRVSNIITTNYDKFLEELFPNYLPLIGQIDLFNRSTSSIGMLYKIHGSIDNPNTLVISQEDYNQFNNKLKYLSAKLLTYFIEFPLIFIGYGVSDSNIKSILKDIKICLSTEKAEELSNQILFIENTEILNNYDLSTIEIEGIRMTKITLPEYNSLYEAFSNILDAIDIETLRKIQGKISQLVQNVNTIVDRVYATSLENKSLNDEDLAIFIGHKTSVFELGYSGIKLTNICEDILFNSRSYDSYGIINNTILSQKNIYSRSKIPLYKYLSNYHEKLDDFYSDSKCIINSIDDIYNAQDKKTRLYLHPIKELNFIIGTNDQIAKKIQNIFYSLKSLDIFEVKEYIKSIWSRIGELRSTTYLTKIICVIDLVENKKE